MCSVGDDGPEDTLPAKFMEQKLTLKDKTCNKCKTNSSVVLLRSKDCYCKECFLIGTEHKFKSFLGKLRLSRVVEKVVVSYEPGHSSTTLLQFLRNCLDAPPQKQIKFLPIILYVEKNNHLSTEERREVLRSISDHVETFNFKLYFVSFGEYLTTGNFTLFENWKELRLNVDSEEIDKKFQVKTKLTYNKEILNMYRRDLLIKCAKSLECSFIFTADLTADIAVNLLTNVCLGRGNQLPLDIGVIDDRDEIKIIKPMRYLNAKECAMFNYFNNLEPVIIKEIVEKPHSSVQSLMSNFIDKLQTDYPATVTTVLRTGDKLSVGQSNLPKCEMCKAPIFQNVDKLTSAEATDFSRHLSTMKLNMEIDPIQRYEEAILNYEESSDQKHCYTCRIISKFLLK